MNKPTDTDISNPTENTISELYEMLNQYTDELGRTEDQHRQIELINDIKDIHKNIKQVEQSLLKFTRKNH